MSKLQYSRGRMIFEDPLTRELSPFANHTGTRYSFPICPDILARIKKCYPRVELDQKIKNLFEEEENINYELHWRLGIEIPIQTFKDLFPHQMSGARWMSFRKKCILADEQGTGKALEENSVVLTSQGFKKIKSLDMRDLVFGEDGKAYPLEGIFPQGKRKLLKIEFQDGSSVTCDRDHLWNVQTTRMRQWRITNFKTIRAEEIIPLLKIHSRVYIPMTDPIKFEFRPVPVDPYHLGLLLGDGSFRNGRIQFTNSEEDVMKNISENYLGKLCERNGTKEFTFIGDDMISHIRKFGLLEKYSNEKFIPDEYLLNDSDTRLSLLKGLIDSDGECNGSYYNWSTTSPRLLQGIQFLIQSLGGTCKFSKRKTSYIYKNEKKAGKLSYKVQIKMPKGMKIHTSMKHENKFKLGQTCSRRYITKISEVEEGNAFCIKTSNPSGLFITNEFIVTHNTVTSLAAASLSGKTNLCIVCSTAKFKDWQEHADKWFRVPGKTVQITTYKSFPKVEGYDILIIDEAHKLRNRKSAYFKAIRSAASKIEYVFMLTGTPNVNEAGDIWSLLNICDPKKFGSYWGFVYRFCLIMESAYGVTVGGMNPNEIENYKDLIYEKYLIARRSTEVFDVERITCEIPMSEQHRDYYKQYVKGKVTMQDVGTLLKAAVDPASVDSTNHCLYTKYDSLVNLVENVWANEPHSKFIVFVKHIEVAERVRSLLARDDFSCAAIHSQVSKKKIDKTIELFQKKDLDALVITFGIGGEGLNLTAANNMIIFEFPWTYAAMSQGEARFLRIGQKQKNLKIYSLYMRDTLEERVLEIINNKQDLSLESLGISEIKD